MPDEPSGKGDSEDLDGTDEGARGRLTAVPSSTAGEESPTLLDDLLGLLPRLIDRTSAQVQFSQTLLSMLPCTRNLVSDVRVDDAETPGHEAPQPGDVLSLLDEEPAGEEPGAARAGDQDDGTGDDPLAPDVDMSATASSDGSTFDAGAPPAVEELAIPDYDSLAASQVVPRLTTLAASELEAIGSYEAANRSRRTIINRVTALLAG